ncbi:MAG: rod shape-determining protein MreD [Chloroflexota bacterium]
MSAYLGIPFILILGTLSGWLATLPTPITPLRPNLLLLAAVSSGLLGGYPAGLLWGGIAGLAFDLLSAAPLGAGLIPLAGVGLLSGIGQAGAVHFNRLLPLQAALLATVVFDLGHMLLLHLSGWTFNVIVALYEVTLPSALLNLLVMPAVYWMISFLWQRSRSSRESGW